MKSQFDAIIVGGGVSGLTAAFELSGRGHRVALLEPGSMGGMLSTKEQAGFRLEQGPNVILEKPEIASLIDRLGVRSHIVYPVTDNYRQFVWYRNQAVQVPRTPVQFLSSRLFSLAEKGSILRALFVPGVFRPRAENESVLSFFSRGLGEGIVRRVLDPVLKGIYGGEVDDLSAPALFPQLWKAMKEGKSLLGFLKERRAQRVAKPKTFVFQGGMSSLGTALQGACGDRLTHLPVAARSVTVAPGEFSVHTSGGELVVAPKLILALPLRLAAPLFQTEEVLSENLRLLLREIPKRRYAPLAMIHCGSSTAPKFPEHSFGVLFPAGTPGFFLGAMFNSQLFPHLAPTGQHLITLCFGGIAAPNLDALKPSDELVRSVCSEFLGIAAPTILARHCWESAIPQYDSGHQAMEMLLTGVENQYPGLYFATADRGGVGVSDRVKSVMELLNNER